ncbi:WW domain binding protein VOPP1 isoform 2-T2 [Rhynchocyon petersi]
MSRLPGMVAALLLALLAECTEAKKHCWYFEGLYPTYYMFLLMMGVLFCCGAGFFIRRRMYPPPLIEEPAFNVSYTRQPPNPAAGVQQPGPPYYTDPGGPGMNLAGNPMAMAFQVQPNSPQGSTAYPPPPSYCNTPPPPYEQVVKAK